MFNGLHWTFSKKIINHGLISAEVQVNLFSVRSDRPFLYGLGLHGSSYPNAITGLKRQTTQLITHWRIASKSPDKKMMGTATGLDWTICLPQPGLASTLREARTYVSCMHLSQLKLTMRDRRSSARPYMIMALLAHQPGLGGRGRETSCVGLSMDRTICMGPWVPG